MPGRMNLQGSERKAPDNATLVSRCAADERITVSVILRRKTPLDLKTVREPMNRESFAKLYGADDSAVRLLKTFATAHDLTVAAEPQSQERRTYKLTGTTAQMQQAFGVELNEYQQNGKSFRAREGTITLPAELAPVIEAVLGLDTRPQAQAHFRIRTPMAAGTSYTPVQVAQKYDFPTDVTGEGEAIGIIELGGGFEQSDLTQYFAGMGLKTPTVTAVEVDGGTNSPGDPNGADAEVMLDIEVSGAVAPGAKIAVYFGPNTDQGFNDALSTAVHDHTNNPTVISISWGSAESTWTGQAMTAMDNICQSAVALGVTITVASGDSGSSDGVTDGANHVDFPASSPHVLACGGTKLATSGAETVWNDGAEGGASGGGVSAVFALPEWQANAKVPKPAGSTGGRGVPDVAGNADPATGYDVQVDGQKEVIGGTSAVAPLWAGLIALCNQAAGKPQGLVNVALYAAGEAPFHDITSGSNGSFSAGPGWDACTGLGSPNGTKIAAVLSGASPTKKPKR
jgi:kumamolisin